MPRKHGHTSGTGRNVKRSITYNTYRCMLERCYRRKHKWWLAYGGRGIVVCEEWQGKTGFATFLRDMGERPDKGMTLDRIRGEEGYSKDNCKWATKSEQRRNQRRSTSTCAPISVGARTCPADDTTAPLAASCAADGSATNAFA